LTAGGWSIHYLLGGTAVAQIERFGTGGTCDRQLFALELPDLESLPELTFPSAHFVCLVVCDATGVDPSRLLRFADALLSCGAVYVLASGPDCERVHDLFDEVIVGVPPSAPQFPLGIMTTWHAHEAVSEALWQFLFASWPDDEFFDTCGSALAIVVGSPSIAEEVRAALRNPAAFNREVIEEGAA
jgi:hypothetical protein